MYYVRKIETLCILALVKVTLWSEGGRREGVEGRGAVYVCVCMCVCVCVCVCVYEREGGEIMQETIGRRQ